MKKYPLVKRARFEEDIRNFGLKYSVQKLFNDLGMCEIKTNLFPSRFSLNEIENTLNELNINKIGVTIRFSHKKDLNLPRAFFKDKKKCLDFISKQDKRFSVIVQEYTNLQNSFELYMNEDIYLQVMPGIWEVSTKNPPDIISEKGGKLRIWRYAKPRLAKFVNPNGEFYQKETPAFNFDELKKFHQKLKIYRDRLNLLNKIFTPLCCHFYMDDKERISFLNVRDFGEFPINNDSPAHFYVINNIDGLKALDKKKPILFNANSERDNETPFVMFIKRLKERGVSRVYVNYGILSHPAILLREAGIQVEQSYALYEKKNFSI